MSVQPVIDDTLQALHAAASAVPDPEIPVLTLADLGILREVRRGPSGDPEIVLTPTYSGCPATEVIRAEVQTAASRIDPNTRVLLELAPAWTTDWITADGRRKLVEYGIAAPQPTRTQPVLVQLGRPPASAAHCPRCGSSDTDLISQFGSTPCKALRRCRSCAEPFDEFKAL